LRLKLSMEDNLLFLIDIGADSSLIKENKLIVATSMIRVRR